MLGAGVVDGGGTFVGAGANGSVVGVVVVGVVVVFGFHVPSLIPRSVRIPISHLP
jgi:hypothetical protein